MAAGPGIPVPFASRPGPVRPEWIDHNGHLNLAYTVLLLDGATDALWLAIGLGAPYRARGLTTFAVETHTLYLAELMEGQETEALSWVVAADRKRLHIAHELRAAGGPPAARQELMYLTVDQSTRRSVEWPADTLARLEASRAGTVPDWIGRRVGFTPPGKR